MAARVVYYIMSGGNGSRWEGQGNKHFIEFNGERLIDRTIRQFRCHGEVRVVGPDHYDPRYIFDGIFTYRTRKIGSAAIFELTMGALSNEDGITCMLLGDVYFSDNAAATIIKTCRTIFTGVNFFGRANGSTRHTKDCGEIFAIAYHSDYCQAMKEGCEIIIDKQREGRAKHARGWELYKVLIDRNKIEKNWTNIDDETEDFDRPCELESWKAAHANLLGQ